MLQSLRLACMDSRRLIILLASSSVVLCGTKLWCEGPVPTEPVGRAELSRRVNSCVAGNTADCEPVKPSFCSVLHTDLSKCHWMCKNGHWSSDRSGRDFCMCNTGFTGVLCDTEVCADVLRQSGHGDCYGKGALGRVCADAVTSCADIHTKYPDLPSCDYHVRPTWDSPNVHHVYCDMDQRGGGWTVFVRRLDGSQDFNRTWQDYKAGFGAPEKEYWLGLETLHRMTTAAAHELLAVVESWSGDVATAYHPTMLVQGEAEKYNLRLGPFQEGRAGNALDTCNENQFSTYDQDNDKKDDANCAVKFGGGFWFNYCLHAHPTGVYYENGNYNASVHNGLQWRSWPKYADKWYSMKHVAIMIRPTN